MFDFLDTTTSRYICFDRNHLKFLFFSFLDHLPDNINALGVLLHFSNEFSDFLVEYLETVYLHASVFEEEAVIEHLFIYHDGVQSFQVSRTRS